MLQSPPQHPSLAMLRLVHSVPPVRSILQLRNERLKTRGWLLSRRRRKLKTRLKLSARQSRLQLRQQRQQSKRLERMSKRLRFCRDLRARVQPRLVRRLRSRTRMAILLTTSRSNQRRLHAIRNRKNLILELGDVHLGVDHLVMIFHVAHGVEATTTYPVVRDTTMEDVHQDRIQMAVSPLALRLLLHQRAPKLQHSKRMVGVQFQRRRRTDEEVIKLLALSHLERLTNLRV